MKKIVLSGVIIIVIGIVGAIASFAIKNPFHTVSLHKKETVNSNGINDLEVISSSTDVHITRSNQKDVTVEFLGKMSKTMKDKYKLVIEKNGGKLRIELKRKDFINFNIVAFSQTKLSIKIPEHAFDSISVQTSSGDIKANNIHAGQLSMKAGSGDINLEDGIITNRITIVSSSGEIHALHYQASNVTMNTSSGDIVVGNGNVEQKLVLKTSSGDIQTEDYDANSVSMETNSGDIGVNGQTTNQSNFSTSSGSTTLEDITGNIDAGSSSGDIMIYPNEKIGNITVKTSSGDVEIKTQQKGLSFSIDFKGHTGDGKVNLDGVLYKEKSEHQIIGKVGEGTIKWKVSTSSGDFKLE
jgi:lia operon protein LiaG